MATPRRKIPRRDAELMKRQGESLRRHRESAGLSMKDLFEKAKVTGIALNYGSFQQIKMMESGKRIVDDNSANAFARALGIKPEDILCGEECSPPTTNPLLMIEDVSGTTLRKVADYVQEHGTIQLQDLLRLIKVMQS